jgi:hypothetical protein
MVIRICRHCNSIIECKTAAEAKKKKECPHCHVESIWLTEKQAVRLAEKIKRKEDEDKELIEQAKVIHGHLSDVPIMAYDRHPGFSCFINAVAMSISIPENTTDQELKDLIKKAKGRGIQRNPYVFAGWEHDDIWNLWSSKIPAYPNLIRSLIKFNICTDKSITASDGERIMNAITKYEDKIWGCPYCGYFQTEIDRCLIDNICKKCKRIIKKCLYKADLSESKIYFYGMFSDGYLRIANGPTFKYVPHRNSWSGYAVKEIGMPGNIPDHEDDLSQTPVIHLTEDRPMSYPQKVAKNNNIMKYAVIIILLLILLLWFG